MRKNAITVVALLLVIGHFAISGRAEAQTAKRNTVTPAGVEETRVFPLKNIPKPLMLQWMESRVVKNGTTSVFPDVISVWDWRAVAGENAIAVRGKPPSLQVLQEVVDGLEKRFALVECDVYVAFLKPGEYKKLRPARPYQYDRFLRAWEENLEKDLEEQHKHSLQVIGTFEGDARQKIDLMLLSPDAYVLSGKGVLYNGFLQSLRLVRSDMTGTKTTRKMPDLETTLSVTTTFARDDKIEFDIHGLIASSGEKLFPSGIQMIVKNNETFFILAPKVPAALSAALGKVGAPRNAEVVVAFTPHVLRKMVAPEDK